MFRPSLGAGAVVLVLVLVWCQSDVVAAHSSHMERLDRLQQTAGNTPGMRLRHRLEKSCISRGGRCIHKSPGVELCSGTALDGLCGGGSVCCLDPVHPQLGEREGTDHNVRPDYEVDKLHSSDVVIHKKFGDSSLANVIIPSDQATREVDPMSRRIFGSYRVEGLTIGQFKHYRSQAAQKLGCGGDAPRGLVARAMPVIDKFLSRYVHESPHGQGVGDLVLKRIFLCWSNTISGSVVEGSFFFEPGDTIWVTVPNQQEVQKALESTLHHELLHALEERFVGPREEGKFAHNWRRRWFANLPPGFTYKPKFSVTPSRHFTPQAYKDGFLTAYSRTSFVEHVAQFAGLMVGHKEIWQCYKQQRCKVFLDLVMELYQQISPKYTKKFFQDRAKTALANNEHIVYDKNGAPDWLQNHEFYDRDSDFSYEGYVNALKKIPKLGPTVENQEPASFGSMVPVRLALGSKDSTSLYVMTKSGLPVYGYTVLSRRGATYVPESPTDTKRIKQLEGFARSWSQLCPYGLNGFAKNLVLAHTVSTPGRVQGLFYDHPGDTVWVGMSGWPDKANDEKVYVSTIAHEITHLLAFNLFHNTKGKGMSKKQAEGWRERWIKASPPGFEYLGKGAPDSGSMAYMPKYYEIGEVAGYGRINIEESMAMFGQALWLGDKEVWDCAKKPRCRKKVDLMIELFSHLDKKYNRQFFLDRAQGKGPGGAVALRVRGHPGGDVFTRAELEAMRSRDGG